MLRRLIRKLKSLKSPLKKLQMLCECGEGVKTDDYSTIQKWSGDSRIVIGDDL